MSRELQEYFKGSTTTGTQAITLWFAVREILKHKPKWILECGTGASTIVLSLAVEKLKTTDPSYTGKIISMESVEEWFNLATSNLPKSHRNNVEIIYGPREKYEISMFRGYIHSNIPPHPYDFVFLDGPNFDDENGSTFCADALYVLKQNWTEKVIGVFDARVSSAFVLQTLFGRSAIKYFVPSLAGTFYLKNRKDFERFVSTDFRNTISGRVFLRNRFK